ncbi:MAG: peptide ABC transporter substrate-binding protein [Chloroflexota bacterium]|jgi:oligopeptide transport system substrate-binding protein
MTLIPDSTPPLPDRPHGWSRRAIIGTALLVTLFISIGLFAAWTVTPRTDEEALPRPAGADIVLAGGTPLSWDPAAISDGTSAQVLSQLYEGLTVLDAGSRVQPALAESWQVEDDGLRLVFQLRDDLAFSDGSALTAEDVRRSWLRVIDPARPGPLASLLDDVAGASAYARGEGSAEAVGLQARGQTLTVNFEHPASFFPAVAAAPTLAVVPPGIDRQARGPGDDSTFVGSGAYVPLDQELGRIRLARNERYWAGPAPIERVTVVTDDGGRSNVDVFEDEAVDWTRIAASDASWIRYDRYLGPQLRHTEEMAVELLGFDAGEPPFDDPAVRRAVSMAVDWRTLAGLDDADGPPPTSIVPPGVAGRGDEDYQLPYDPAAARAELAAAGYPGGEGFPAVALATYGVGPAEAIAAELGQELGIEVNVERRSFDEHGLLLERDTPDLWTLAWSADYPHAHDFLGLLLASDSSANVTGWGDDDYDRLIEAAATTADADEQERLYGQAQAIVREAAPLIPLDYGSSWWLSRDGLQGGRISGVGLVRYADLAWAR